MMELSNKDEQVKHMVMRQMIVIEEDKCNGCGLCIPNCPEGALQIIDGKARLVSDLMCDGLGACIGHCPRDAMHVEEREARPYDERKVMENIIKAGPNTIKAHLEHLDEHGETEYLKEAINVLQEKGVEVPMIKKEVGNVPCGCPGSKMMDFNENNADSADTDDSGTRPSRLRQWPVQLHLVAPFAPYFQEKDVLLAADCTAFALGDFHKNYLKDKSLAIACPKLDSDQEVYIEKITSLIDESKINTLTVMTMEVPCCGGLLHIAEEAARKAERKIPVKSVVVGINGNILSED